jgi:3-oxoacyl-[acyl-carrier protein] reductase
MEFRLNNKNVLITASSMGIGRVTAELFLSEGANVVICSRNKEHLVKASEEIKHAYGKEVLWEVCDLDKLDDIENIVKFCESHLGTIDILVNNCGGPRPGFFDDLNENDWQNGFHQVLLSAVRFSKLVLPSMIKNNWGRIINITSISVKQPIDNLILSNAFRSALTAMSKTISLQVGKSNITINNVAPGYTLTQRLYELSANRAKLSGESQEEILTKMANDVPMKRLANPEEVGSLIVYLASEIAGYITGTTSPVDGGITKSTY